MFGIFKNIVLAVTLSHAVFICNAAPTMKRAAAAFTCKHKSEASNKDWKHCSNNGADVLGLSEMNIPQAIAKNLIPSIDIPANSFKCFRTSTYSPSNSRSNCPALCRLRDMKESKECKVGDALNTNHLEEHGIAVAKSPRYDCPGTDYFRNEVCIYNISMGCAGAADTDIHTDISSQSDIELGDGDSIDVFSYKTGGTSHKLMSIGSGQALSSHTHIPATDFIMVFTSNADAKQGRGFNIQLECPDIAMPTVEYEEDNEESSSSGDQQE